LKIRGTDSWPIGGVLALRKAAPDGYSLHSRGLAMQSNRRLVAIVIAAVMAFGVVGCSGQPLSTREKSTGIGALVGAGTGAIIGAAVGSPAAGAAIGGAIGTAGGFLVGNELQNRDTQQQQTQSQLDSQQQQIEQQRREIEQLKSQSETE
jgi:phage tail tape-measure protein